MSVYKDEVLSNVAIAFSCEQYESALEQCKKIIKTDEHNIEAYVFAGNSCIMLDRLPEAESYFSKAIELNSSNGDLYFSLGHSQYGQKKYSEALRNYAKAEQYGCSEENRQKLYYLMGILCQAQGNDQAALINFEKSSNAAPTNANQKDIVLKTVQIYVEQGDMESAEEYAVQYKLLAPDEFKSYQLLFQIYLEAKKTDEAVAVLDEAEKNCPLSAQDEIDISFDRALVLCFKAENEPEHMAEHFESAIAQLEELEKGGALPLALQYETVITRAEIYIKLGKHEHAYSLISNVADASETDDEEANALIYRARLLAVEYLLSKEEYEKACEYSKLQQKSKDPAYQYHAYYSEAFATKMIARNSPELKEKADKLYEYAIAFLRSYSASVPGDILAFLYRAKAYADIGEYEKATELCGALPDEAQKEMKEYIKICKKEIKEE